MIILCLLFVFLSAQPTAETEHTKLGDDTQQSERWDKKLSSLESKVEALVAEAEKDRPPSVDGLSHKVTNLEKQLEALTSPPSNEALIERSR